MAAYFVICDLTSVSHFIDRAFRYINGMALIARVKVNWTGFIGAPGFTNLHFAPTDFGPSITQTVVNDAQAKVDTWLNAWKAAFPTTVLWGVDPTVEVIEDSTGDLQEYMTVTPEAVESGSQAGAYAAASGAVVNWSTAGVRNGRRVRGRTFMVPLSGAAFESNGTLLNTALTGWRNASTAMITTVDAATLVVWSRPSGIGASDGISHAVTAATIADKAAVLTSRRD
jgi:hypothetical protein